MVSWHAKDDDNLIKDGGNGKCGRQTFFGTTGCKMVHVLLSQAED